MLIQITYDNNGHQKTQIYNENNILISETDTSLNGEPPKKYKKNSNTVSVGKSVFFLPNREDDLIQGCIADTRTYYDQNFLKILSGYLNENSVVIDIGANIGNHTLYFANECNVKKVYSFEPVPYTFKILKKNIKLNNLEDKVEIHRLGLSDKVTKGRIKEFRSDNIGGTRLEKYAKGDLKLVTLDSLNLKEKKIDLIKIDVEAMDYLVLCGAIETIKKYKPVINIESYNEEWAKSDPFLRDLGYEIAHKLSICEYIYIPKYKNYVPKKNEIHLTDKDGNNVTKFIDGRGNIMSEEVKCVVPVFDIPLKIKKSEIIKVRNSVFCLPDAGRDLIQTSITSGAYFDSCHLDVMANYLNKNSVVLDIGANIGNHTLFFANECNVKKVYAFEPVPYTFKILKKNIELNNLEDRVEIKNVGFSDTISKGAIKQYDLNNIGGTRLKTSPNGKIKLITLDSLNIKEKIDFIKIDVEAMDYLVLCGAIETIKKNMPVIEIESFDSEREKSEPLLFELGYRLEKDMGSCEYLYVPDKKQKKRK